MLFSCVKLTLRWPEVRLGIMRDLPIARKIHRRLDQAVYVLAATTKVKGFTVIAVHAPGSYLALKEVGS
jgi:hypothetical protein